MAARMVAIWFPLLMTDWMRRRRPALRETAFALVTPERGRRVVKAVNDLARAKGVRENMVLADGRALAPDLQVFDYDAEQPGKLLPALAEWCIRYSPYVSVDLPDGLIISAEGCTHLWGGEEAYLSDMDKRLRGFGYHVRLAMADTIGAARAVGRFGKNLSVVAPGAQVPVLSALPPAALRLEPPVLERLDKLGLHTIGSFMKMPRPALRRRFGQGLLRRMDQAFGYEMEIMDPVKPVSPYQERLPAMEPIRSATGIEIALQTLLDLLCARLNHESKGLRTCELICHRMDGMTVKIAISTTRPSRSATHLFKLFESRIAQLEPGTGIELFILEAPVVEELNSTQDALWTVSSQNEAALSELLDRLTARTGADTIRRYLPAQHYWPERSFKTAGSLTEKPASAWRTDLPRPLHLLAHPQPVDVTVPLPDYPPLLFKYRGILHTVKKADGPERIEQEWWIGAGLYRDYYCVEDEQGARYWLFRSGDYNSGNARWFLHGFFA